MRYCPRCGNAVLAGNFCPACLSPLVGFECRQPAPPTFRPDFGEPEAGEEEGPDQRPSWPEDFYRCP